MRQHEGRQIFHRFCRLSTKYDEKDAEKKYSDMLKKNTGRVLIGGIVSPCLRCGMDKEDVRQCLIESQRKLKTERYSVTALHCNTFPSSLQGVPQKTMKLKPSR